MPANQCLEAYHLAGGYGGLRLVNQQEFAVCYGLAQLGGEGDAVSEDLLHPLLVETPAGLIFGAGGSDGAVGVLHQLSGAGAMLRVKDEAHGGGDMDEH